MYWKRGARVGVKYALAILAAYTAYESLKNSNGKSEGAAFLGKAAAFATFIGD